MARILGQMGQVGQGAAGLTLPLPLKTIQGLVALMQGEAGEVEEEVKDAVVLLGMGEQEECDSQATGEDELLSYWENEKKIHNVQTNPLITVKMKENTMY